MSSSSPAHRLGPQVVGQRVVIRRLVPGRTGPTGGPAFTDVLGVCTAWGESSCVVDADSGPVEIPLALIVSGKPVPPRPSVRHRVSARDAELHTASLFPTVSVTPLGEWQLRLETRPVGRLLKRANSCLAMGSPGVPVPSALAQVASFYAANDRRPLVQVEADSSVEAEILGAGWAPLEHGEAAYLIAPVAQLSRRLAAAAARPEPRVILPSTAVIDGNTTRVSSAEATGIAVLDGDWVGIHGVWVDPEHRRRGLATQVMAALVEWAAEQGARTAWLHVETDNPPALALYERLGFSEHHRCRYLSPQ